jgi:hypothetical protein
MVAVGEVTVVRVSSVPRTVKVSTLCGSNPRSSSASRTKLRGKSSAARNVRPSKGRAPSTSKKDDDTAAIDRISLGVPFATRT